MIQLFDIKTRTLGFTFVNPPKKSLPKSLTQKSQYKISNPKKVLRLQISNPKKGFAHPRHLYTWAPSLGLNIFAGPCKGWQMVMVPRKLQFSQNFSFNHKISERYSDDSRSFANTAFGSVWVPCGLATGTSNKITKPYESYENRGFIYYVLIVRFQPLGQQIWFKQNT